MPPLLQPGQRQLSTEDANTARIVTKTRWIVEARNGHIKTKFKYLDHDTQVHVLPNIGDFYRIAGAIINSVCAHAVNASLYGLPDVYNWFFRRRTIDNEKSLEAENLEDVCRRPQRSNILRQLTHRLLFFEKTEAGLYSEPEKFVFSAKGRVHLIVSKTTRVVSKKMKHQNSYLTEHPRKVQK
ncbi:unnamed protein product, partial [Trichogramma brassicae]